MCEQSVPGSPSPSYREPGYEARTPPACVFGGGVSESSGGYLAATQASLMSGSQIMPDGEPQQLWSLVGLVGGVVIPLLHVLSDTLV